MAVGPVGVLGRVFFIIIFILGNVRSLMKWELSINQPLKAGVPAEYAPAIVVGTAVLAFLGSLCILFGQMKPGAACYTVFLIIVGFTKHYGDYLAAEGDPQQQWMTIVQVCKNLALVGACLMFVDYDSQIRKLQAKEKKKE
ncbi:unnamed protein product [Vitrella brassicaformis CCMP3155]|uniref:DoxX family protein n=2 Tax=Vitrella brassicaformis TaxID=1169539 RepID=A0A0G4GZK5_VITBC|nr:unnamed protein product [Vitrella brassicaformis CCMP3155]|mmetsp:Transcript_49487/g.124123  ORF Transcript_49487/g.124123 Transcript_49487/m.124123 type:complete len:141 (+) Transcript_49487:86-508(+)|eukprot:CEM36645.1 unnamed protein product [Vitrella brassicaformis CCMP3155]